MVCGDGLHPPVRDSIGSSNLGLNQGESKKCTCDSAGAKAKERWVFSGDRNFFPYTFEK